LTGMLIFYTSRTYTMYQLFKENKVGNDYCVGDLHGNYEALFKLMKQVNFNIEVDRLFCVGDLVDRGRNSEDVLELLKQSWFFTVRGNHEDILIANGLKSYEECYPEKNKDGSKWFFNIATEKKIRIMKAFRDLPYAIQVGKIGIVHAFPLNDWKDTLKAIKNKNDQEIKSLIWNRGPAKAVQAGKKINQIKNIDSVIVGHHVFEKPERHANVIFLDTGFYQGGSLSLINLKTLEVVARIFNKDKKLCD